MIHTTLGALAAAEDSIKAVAELKLPAKTAYSLSKLLTAATAELEHWHKQRLKWVKEFGETNAEGVTAVRPDAMSEFIAHMNDLAAVAVELAVTPVTLDLFGETEMAVRDMAALIGAGLLVDPDVVPTPHLVEVKKGVQ